MGCSNMRLKEKPKKSYNRQVLDSIQQALGREDIGIQEEFVDSEKFLIITDMNSEELSLSTADELKIRALAKVREKLE